MAIKLLNQFKSLSGQEQAAQYHRRARRRSHTGLLDLHRTHRLTGASNLATTFDGSVIFLGKELAPVTFKTTIKLAANTSTRSGLIMETSDASGGTVWSIGDSTIDVVSGAATGDDNVSLSFDNVEQLPAELILELVLSINPGLGAARLWADGKELARAVSASGDLGTIGWTAGDNGSFGQAANGATPVGAPTGAPTNFTIVEPLSVFVGQRPRQFV